MVAAVAALAGCGTSHRPGGGLADGSGGNGAGAAGKGGTGGKGGAGNAGSGGSSGRISVMDAGAGGDCEREVTLQAVVLGEPAPFDLIIVADHSDSLAWSRAELSSGLQDLLTHVQGRSVRVFLLTPTQYGASSKAANTAFSTTTIVAWQDAQTLEPYMNAVTEYVETCNDPTGHPIVCPEPASSVLRDEYGKWNFVMPEPVAVIEPDMTDAEFASEQAAVADAILALGGSGSPEEQPLCTLGRYVSQAASELPENAVFVVITDEDDVSVPDDCLVSFDMSIHETTQNNGAEPCSADCDAYRYGMTGDSYLKIYPYTCAAFSDTGERIAGSERGGWLNVPSTTSCSGLSGACSPEEEADAAKWCDSGLTLVECTRECTVQTKRCEVDVSDPSIDACTESFSYNGQTWASLAAYCVTRGDGFHDCSGGGVNLVTSTSISGSQSHENLMPGTDASAVARYFTAGAASAFGPGRYLVEGIVFDPRFGCQLGIGQSYATNIIGAIGDPTHVFSLCDSYAPALDGVLDFAQALIETEFSLTLADDEHVTAVVVLGKDGSERILLGSEYTFDETSGRLSIQKSAIHGREGRMNWENGGRGSVAERRGGGGGDGRCSAREGGQALRSRRSLMNPAEPTLRLGRRAHARLFSVPIRSPNEWQAELPERRRGRSGRRARREAEPREQLSCILRGSRRVHPAHWSRAAGASIEVSGEHMPEQPSPALAPRWLVALGVERKLKLITGSRRGRGSVRIGRRTGDDLLAQARAAREHGSALKVDRISHALH